MRGPWLVAFLALWVVVVVLAVATFALLRQIGVLHQRLAPMGTHFASEGPDLDSTAPSVGLDWSVSALTVLLFTSPTCVLCRELKPSLDAFRRQYRELRVHMVDLEADPAVFDAMAVRSTPYVVAVDGAGVVRGRGVANSLEQIEELVREAQLTASSARVRS
jgi:thiol-disulfide isomerase/thioredoxin